MSCTFNIISVAAVDYGGNSIGVGLVTWVFFSRARHQPPDHETADREATSTPQKYSQMIAAAIIQMQGISAAMLNIGNPWSHSYLAMDTICPILAPLRDRGGGGAAVGRGLAGSGLVSGCAAGICFWDGCCLNGESDQGSISSGGGGCCMHCLYI